MTLNKSRAKYLIPALMLLLNNEIISYLALIALSVMVLVGVMEGVAG